MRFLPLAALALMCFTAPAFGDDISTNIKRKVTQSRSYMRFDPIYTTILENDRPVGILLLGVGLDVPDEKYRSAVQFALPLLRDAYVRSLISFSATLVHVTKQPDVDVIADRLQSVTNRALGGKRANILLSQVVIRATR